MGTETFDGSDEYSTGERGDGVVHENHNCDTCFEVSPTP